jgi:hypothetical protein
MEKNNKIKWRDGSIGTKEFYKLSKEQRNIYIKDLLKIPVDERSNSDEYILNFYGPKENKLFIKLDEEL